MEIWAARGAFVLRVNYRGSSGYGRKFRELDYRSFGIGDGADVLSGIDFLVGKGWVDPKRIACMGWSHGGYLTAYLAVTTQRFAAVSVGAGAVDWTMYYYNNPGLAQDYHGARPLDDPEIYQQSSVLTHAKGARTPTLIQHGELDSGVGQAYILRQVLVDKGVPVELIVYRGAGHNLGRPSSQRSAALHNLLWFNHYLWGDPLPDVAAVLSTVQE
jgi:dipeptidyl aminopeptidase/acylaminoacyl peptidase